MKNGFKKFCALFMCICMFCSLLPGLPAAAAAADYIYTVPADSDVTKVDGFDSGFVFKFTQESNNLVKVEVGVYNVVNTAMYNLRIKYDASTVEFVKNAAGAAMGTWDNISNVLKANTAKLPASILGDGPDRSTATWVDGGEYTDYVPMEYTQTTVLDKTAGTLFIELQSKDTETMGTMMPTYIEGFINPDQKTDLTFAQDGFTSLFNLYFKVIDGQEIGSNTFSLIEDSEDTSAPNGASFKRGDTKTVQSEKTLWVGFPASTEPPVPADTVPVKVQVYAQRESITMLKTGAEVTIQSADGNGGTVTDAYNKSFTTSETGLLMVGNTIVAEDNIAGSGVLNLPVGWYQYTVTPTSEDTGYSKGTGYFEVTASNDTQDRNVYAQPATSGESMTYTLRLLDGESANRVTPFAEHTSAKVTVAGTVSDLEVNAEGAVTVSTKPDSGAKAVTVEMDGYVKQELSVVFQGDGSLSGSGVVDNAITMAQKRTNVTLTVPQGSYVTIAADPDGTVTPNMAANELPMNLKPEDGTTVTAALPDGDYTYTIVTPGNEDLEKKLDVDANGTTGKVTIKDPDGNNAQDLTVVPDGTGATAGSATANEAQTGTPDAITDPLYYVVGDWKMDSADKVTGMEVKLYLKNTIATVGTFGLQYDPKVFGLDSTITYNEGIETPELILPDAATQFKNPLSDVGYYLFQWKGKDAQPVDASSEAQLLATFNLTFVEGVDNSNYQSKITTSTLTGLTFTNSKWYEQAASHYGSDAVSLKTFADQYWRAVDAANDAPVGSLRLEAGKAIGGGFYQTFNTVTDPAAGQDTRSQFVYETFGGTLALQFVVTSDGTAPVPGATVTVKAAGTETVLGAGATDTAGKISFPVPNANVDYVITAEGFEKSTGTVKAENLGQVQNVTLITSTSHDVVIHEHQADTIRLVGGKAYNGHDYYFTLDTRPGYSWNNGLPAVSDLIVKMVAADSTFDDTTEPLEGLTWDVATGRYMLPGTSIVDALDTSKIVIQVAEPAKPTENPAGYTVTVTAGENGSFDYTDVAAASSFTGDSTATSDTNVNYIVETLAKSETESAKYSFKGNGPVSEEDKTAQQAGGTYKAYVIYSFTVNGTEMTLTDSQRINGMKDYQLVQIDRNQTIAVTFGQASIDGKGTPGTGDDVIVGDITPSGKSNVTLILSDHGKASGIQANGSAAAPPSLDGAATQTYPVNAGSSFSATFAGDDSVAQPVGEPVRYVIDTVTVDGAVVNGETAGTGWNSESSTLTLTALAEGTNHTVVVTFKPENGESVFATVELVHRAGDGTATPVGTSIWNVGLPADFSLTPGTGSDLKQIDLTEPGADPADVTESAVKQETAYAYQTPALKAGTTVLGYAFRDGENYTVRMEVQYMKAPAVGEGIKPGSAATFTFTRVSDGTKIVYGPNQLGDYHLDKPVGTTTTHTFQLPAGTWNVDITKNGYLNYSVNGFVIANADGGAVTAGYEGRMDTKVASDSNGTVIYFGQTSTEASARPVRLTIGDATWDGMLIALNDIAQVANGLLGTASAGQKQRADLDESGSVTVTDMTYVVDAYGARGLTESYQQFMS